MATILLAIKPPTTQIRQAKYVSSINKIMTPKEADCFRALTRWKRSHLRQRLKRVLQPRSRFFTYIKQARPLGKLIIGAFFLLILPLLLLIWAFNIARIFLMFPFQYLSTYIKPRGLRPPGERNIKGVHYQFALHIDLPPRLYVQCVDDWVRILYGPEKLPKYSLSSYLDSNNFLLRKVAYEEDIAMYNLLKSQISNAREDLSQDLGHY